MSPFPLHVHPSTRSHLPFLSFSSILIKPYKLKPQSKPQPQPQPKPPLIHQRPIHFYDNSLILRYAQLDLNPFSLRQLLFFAKVLALHPSDLLQLDRNLLLGANFLRTQLPIRLARQIREFQALPYIVTSNPHLIQSYNLYIDAFHSIRSYPHIRTRSQNQSFCAFLTDLLNRHKIIIPKLAIGIAETAQHLSNPQIERFMTSMFHSRISRRVLAEHHIALTQQFQDYRPQTTTTNQKNSLRYLGLIDTELDVASVIDRCIRLAQSTLVSHLDPIPPNPSQPLSVQVSGQKDVKFAYIPDHLEFILFELLLNAFRMTIHSATRRSIEPCRLPIQVQIASSSTHISIRISDQAGGILPPSWIPSSSDEDTFPPSVSRREMFSFVNLTTANDSLKTLVGSPDGMEGKVHEQIDPVSSDRSSTTTDRSSTVDHSSQGFKEIQEARLRIGLPLSSIYAQFFGGSLEIYSIPGSADVVLCIPKLGTMTQP